MDKRRIARITTALFCLTLAAGVAIDLMIVKIKKEPVKTFIFVGKCNANRHSHKNSRSIFHKLISQIKVTDRREIIGL
jgi:hypothetical protein